MPSRPIASRSATSFARGGGGGALLRSAPEPGAAAADAGVERDAASAYADCVPTATRKAGDFASTVARHEPGSWVSSALGSGPGPQPSTRAMPTTPPPSGEPHARGSVIHGFRAASRTWGEEALVATGGASAARDARRDHRRPACCPSSGSRSQHVIAWHDALWNGPCAATSRSSRASSAAPSSLGFGRFKSAFFHALTPDRLVARAPELWRWQHTHGELTARVEGGSGTVVTLKDHPYVDNPVSRRVTAESYRHIVDMAGARDVHAAWGVSADGARDLRAGARARRAAHMAMHVAALT